ncbi:MAG: peptide chain release factor N(5)-glutamine methyltransferase [Pseudomonadota bacterium]
MSRQSYRDLIQAGADQLRLAGLADPVREARRLLQLTTDFSATTLISCETDEACPNHIERFTALVARRADRVPFAHLKGEAEFYGLTLKSDARALIPRADTETVVDLALNRIPEDADWTIADLGTGTGALLAALLTQRTQVRGTGIEASESAYELAGENLKHLGLEDRADLFLGSWANWSGWKACDLIVSNPPYIERAVLAALEPEVRDHDPVSALDGGQDGLDAYREIIALGAKHMRPGAHLVLEIGFEQKQAVSDLLSAAAFANVSHRKDLGGNDRAIAATKT